MSDMDLGRLIRVDLRDVWTSESADFTPWLARPDNLAVLADTLGMELELEAQEKSVGPFRADLLCKDIATDTWVLVENQLERTDHSHLGQLLTYASGLQAVSIVWISARFTEEHRSTLDWLNKITDESFRFFGLEVELWRIGGSPAAPKFNIVSKPNDWSRQVRQAARAIDDADISDTKRTQVAYWEGLHRALLAAAGPVSGNRKAQPQSWMNYSIGRTGFMLGAVMVRPRDQIRAELYITGPRAKAFLRALLRGKEAVEAELGYPLDWDMRPDGQDTRISTTLDGVRPDDASDWPRQHEWLARKLNDLHRALARRVARLDPDDTEPGPDLGPDPGHVAPEGRAQ